MVNSISYYELLKVSKSATARDIKNAYRERCMENHPDIRGNDPLFHELMCKINEAYEVLSDEEMRIAYDRTIEEQQIGINHSNDDDATTCPKSHTPEYYKMASYFNDDYTSERQRETYRYYYSKENDFDEYEYYDFVKWLERYKQIYLDIFIKKYNEDENFRTEGNANIFKKLSDGFESIVSNVKEKVSSIFQKKIKRL